MQDVFKLVSLLVLTFAVDISNPAEEEIGFCLFDANSIEPNQYQCNPNPNFSYSTDPKDLQSFPELIIPVVFWGINRTDGSHDNALTNTKASEAVQLLNSAFEIMNICFELKDIKQIKDSEIYWTVYYKFNKHIKKNYRVTHKDLNIYVPYRFTNNNNNLRGGKWSPNQLSVNMLNYNTGILPHEVGHILGLLHTHTGATAVNCEHVTRDENNPDYNAKCAGDRVTDTNATPKLYGKFHLINDNCEYEGNLKNCKGEMYQLTELDVRNFMAYTQHSCRSVFTIGQGIRVREFIRNSKEKGMMNFVKKNSSH